jgi:hypothetical protein
MEPIQDFAGLICRLRSLKAVGQTVMDVIYNEK